LIDEPADSAASEFLFEEWIDQKAIAAQNPIPIEAGETIGLALRFDGFIELDEGVVFLHETQFQPSHLLGQPVVAIDVDLERKRSPGLQADMDQTELGIEKIVVENALGAWPGDDAGSSFAGHKCKGVAGFLGAEDADQAAFDALLANELLSPVFLAEVSGAIEIGAAALLARRWACSTRRSLNSGARTLKKWLRRTRSI